MAVLAIQIGCGDAVPAATAPRENPEPEAVARPPAVSDADVAAGVAILPFNSPETDPRFHYLARGIHADLLTQLSNDGFGPGHTKTALDVSFDLGAKAEDKPAARVFSQVPGGIS